MSTRRAADAPTVNPADLDLGHLALFVGAAVNAHVQQALDAKGFDDIRSSHGYVFQHLVAGPRSVSALAAGLGVSQQAASKVVAELTAMGYLERVGQDGDKRVSPIGLARRGRDVVAAARKIRAALAARLAKAHGERALNETRKHLAAILETLGGSDAVRERRVRQPR